MHRNLVQEENKIECISIFVVNCLLLENALSKFYVMKQIGKE